MTEKIGIIGGSGLGDELAAQLSHLEKINIDTPFGSPSDAILEGQLAGRDILFLNRHGAGHKFNPSNVPYRANIYALKKLGADTVISTCAAGSLSEKMKPKDIVLVSQLIDKTFKRQNTFYQDMAVHCEMAEPYCSRLRNAILKSADKISTNIHSNATYVCMEGPQFSTKAEAEMHRKWGGDLIGMTAMPEAKLAKEAQMCFALLAMISDYDCWRDKPAADSQRLLAEIIGNLNAATANTIKLIETVLLSDEILSDSSCACQRSMELAIFTQKEFISQKSKDLLAVLSQ